MTTLLLSTGSDEAKKDGPKVFEKMGSYHPKEPHWYFPLLGVDPLHQGNGLGSALLQHTLAVCDIKTISLPISNHQT
ncbi:MAG: GNAT family N-acetyltransferase [Nitrososphaeraceae archaeon]